jgi:chromosome segregation ATPase
LVETATKSEQRLEKQRDEISKLKDERTQLKHDLEAAREALKNGGGTEAELEAAREEIRRLSQENANLERRAEYEKKQSDYTREQYQNASTAAAQSGIEIRQLKEQNEELKRKAAADVAKLKELKTSYDESRHIARVTELEATLASRDELLRKKEDELRDLKRNRPSTRSTSTQPRSPKWASANSRPTSPGVNNSSVTGRGSALRFSSEMST